MQRSNVITVSGSALIVERQAFFIPYLRSVLAGEGLRVSESRALTAVVLRLARPDAIVLGASGLGRLPLDAIRLARRECPLSTIVVVTYDDDPAWSALAKAMGADTILGPRSEADDLRAAIRADSAAGQENHTVYRTSHP